MTSLHNQGTAPCGWKCAAVCVRWGRSFCLCVHCLRRDCALPSSLWHCVCYQEECRAECVGLYLSTDVSVLNIFGHAGEEADDITYINWLSAWLRLHLRGLICHVFSLQGRGGGPCTTVPLFVCCPDMVRAGLLALQFYTPATSAWGQAHMHARHAILRVSGGVPVW
jgi:hypothetical protein